MTLTEFLEARIAEDEAEADYLLGREDDEANAYGKHFLAECAAKRAIIAGRKRIDRSANDDEWSMGYSDANYEATHALAAVYADHPDYRREWAARHAG
jgi:hypothetical protein